MTKTNVQPIPSNSQHHDTPNNKTHVIKFRVTAEEKASLELTCKLLNLSLSTFIRRAIHNVKIEKTIIVAGGGEETLTAVSTLLAQCSKVGSNLNQLARHFNSGGADTEQIRAKLLDELADLLKHIASVARAAALFNHKPHICDIQFDVVANDLNNRIVIKTRTTPPSKRTSFTSTTRSPESNFWMSTASRSCGIRTCSTPLSAALSRSQRPVCWQTASMARTPNAMILRAISISSASTPEMQPTTA